MKIGILGDVHFTNKNPCSRTDDFWATMQRKFDQALSIFQREKCDIVIQPGDIVDSPHVSNVVISYIINILKYNNTRLTMVFGNHDILGHSEATLPSSPLAILKAADVIDILNVKETNSYFLGSGKKGNFYEKFNVEIDGVGFGQDKPTSNIFYGDEKDKYRVLVIHDSISDAAIYPGQEYTQAENFLKLHPRYNLIICGHIHKQFICKYKGRTIINAGPLMRDTIAEHIKNCHPSVIIFDTETNVEQIIPLDIEPIEKVFDLTEKSKRDNDAINRLIEGLKSGNKESTGWREILIRVLKEKNSSPEAKQLIDEFMESINVNK